MPPATVICERRKYSKERQTHSHPYGQLILPLKGSLVVETDKMGVEVDAGHLFYLPADRRHSFFSDNQNEFLVLDIPPGFLNEGAAGPWNEEIYGEVDEVWTALRFLILEEAEKEGGRSHALPDLVRYACRILFPKALPESLAYIHENYHEAITVEQLAQMEHFNKTYYCHWFYNRTGMTPNAYIQKVRLGKAKELLGETDLPLVEIGVRVGYVQQTSLSRLFQKWEGMSPAAYRKQMKSE